MLGACPSGHRKQRGVGGTSRRVQAGGQARGAASSPPQLCFPRQSQQVPGKPGLKAGAPRLQGRSFCPVDLTEMSWALAAEFRVTPSLSSRPPISRLPTSHAPHISWPPISCPPHLMAPQISRLLLRNKVVTSQVLSRAVFAERSKEACVLTSRPSSLASPHGLRNTKCLPCSRFPVCPPSFHAQKQPPLRSRTQS